MKVDDNTNRGCLLIAQLSSKGNLIDNNYITGKTKINFSSTERQSNLKFYIKKLSKWPSQMRTL